ncbi:MAG: methyltransferase domain-containing protein [Parvularculaceae bacterium]|nr:methyltransferase domain-containing protein [Parvularculaceae bacterium]
MNEPIFNRRLYLRRRARGARRFPSHDFLHRRAMADVIDRLETVTRDFPLSLFYGAGPLTGMLTPACGVGSVIAADLSNDRLGPEALKVVLDEDQSPFVSEQFDLIVSLLTLHAVNDPVGALAQMRRALKPDGLLVAVTFGEETLLSLRTAFYAAETATTGGVSPRTAPMASVRDWGAALQRAGFALPVADLDRVRVRYAAPQRLIEDLRGMGETAALARRPRGLSKTTAAALFARLQAAPAIEFDLVTLTGWAPHESQQKPLKPGSAAQPLAASVNRFID